MKWRCEQNFAFFEVRFIVLFFHETWLLLAEVPLALALGLDLAIPLPRLRASLGMSPLVATSAASASSERVSMPSSLRHLSSLTPWASSSDVNPELAINFRKSHVAR